jgi:hypothetical protein
VRNLFLLLLLGNLLLLGWQRWGRVPPAPRPAPPVAQLELLAPAATAPGASVPADAVRCLQLGPFEDPGALAGAARALRAAGREVREVLRPGEVWVGNWVQIDGFGSLEAAEQARRRLVAGGLTDAYIMQVDGAHRISLGVFRERERAEGVLRRARELGFSPALGDRYRPAQEAWLELRLAPGERFDPALLALPPSQILRTEETACPPRSATGDAAAASE